MRNFESELLPEWNLKMGKETNIRKTTQNLRSYGGNRPIVLKTLA